MRDLLPYDAVLFDVGGTLLRVVRDPHEIALERAGLRPYFETIVASGTVGYAKPHPQIFIAALERLGVDPTNALYVGDSVDHDVRGATAAGMPAILLDRNDTYPGHRPRLCCLPDRLAPWS